jgi:hypothetical protein
MQRAIGADKRVGKCRIIDVVRYADKLPVACRANRCLERTKQRRFGGLRIVERLARRIEGRDTALGQKEAHRPFHLVEATADPLADLRALLRRGAHQRNLRVVLVECTVP